VGERYVIRGVTIDPKTHKRKSLFRIGETIQITPMVNDITALQAYGEVRLSLPLAIDNLSFGVDEQKHYLDNAPHGFDKHYQQTTICINYSFGGPRSTRGKNPKGRAEKLKPAQDKTTARPDGI
jgi:hypothetical protein